MSVKKKILLTSLSGQLGGLELRLSDELRFLTKLGYSSELALNHFPEIDPWVNCLRQEGIPFSFFEPPPFFEQWQWRRFNKFRADLFYRRFFKQRNVDLVHVAMAWTDTGGTRLWLAHRCNIPTVISVHNAFREETLSSWGEQILFESFQSVRGIYAVSDSALEQFLKIFSKFIKTDTRVEVIYNPVNLHRFTPSAFIKQELRAQFKIKDDAIVLGVVGRLDGQKQPELLIDVFASLKNMFPQLLLVFIGQGHLEHQCRQKVVDLKLAESVHFLGYQQNVAAVLPMLDIHVLLSTLEGFGIATAEAMACGIPVVATDVPGSRDILKNSSAGLLVPKDNANQIVKTLSDLILNPEMRNSMAQAGPMEVVKRFSSDVIEAKLKDFYQSIL